MLDSIQRDFSMLDEARYLYNEAVLSGTTYRPEHKGFDCIIYERRLKLLIKDLKKTESYSDSSSFKTQVDSLERDTKKALQKVGWEE